MTLPPGFHPGPCSSPFPDLLGPVRQRLDEAGRVTLGLSAEQRHLNRRGVLHGGVLGVLGDVAPGRAATRARRGGTFGTLISTTKFIATANLGEWLQVRATTVHATRSMVFAQGVAEVAEDVVPHLDAVSTIMSRR